MADINKVPPPDGHADDVKPTSDDLRDALMGVVDPELHMNIVDLGLVYKMDVQDSTAVVDMTLTSPGCPYGPYLLHQVNEALCNVLGIEKADVRVVWEPPWGPDKMSEEARLELGFDI
jgi:metal-sulfur cluster biosynthetic enzyme